MSKKLSKEEEQRIRLMMLNNQMILDRRRSLQTAVSGDLPNITPTPPVPVNPTVDTTVLSNWANANRYQASGGPQANTTGFTVWAVFIANTSAVTQLIMGKSNSVTSTQGWSLGCIAGRYCLTVNNISGPQIGTVGNGGDGSNYFEEGKICIIHGVVRSGQIYTYKNGVPVFGSTALGSYTTTAFTFNIGSYSGGPPLLSGIIATGICDSTGLDDSQVEAHYQALLANPYASVTGATNRWQSDNAGATWVDAIGGLSLARNGTVNATAGTQTYHNRYDYRTVVSDTTPLSPILPNVSGGLNLLPGGDSRTAGVGGSNSNAWRQGLYDSIIASGDFSNINFVGPNSSSATDGQHDGNLGWTSGDHIVGKEGKINMLTALTTYNPQIVTIYLGTNSANTDALMAQERIDYMALIRLIKNFNSDIRIIVWEETESSSAIDKARLEAHNWWFWNVAWPTLKAEGVKLIAARMYQTITHAAGDFADSVHQNDQGYGKMYPAIYTAFRLATGRS